MEHHTLLVEAESFTDLGGWVIDQQFMDIMGSPFLLAHGMGIPVKDANTTVWFPDTGVYHLWVRTREWSGCASEDIAPGKFNVLINKKPVDVMFGTHGHKWHWQYGGSVCVKDTLVHLSLHDLTGFDGRCDALLFSTDPDLFIPNKDPEMAQFRRKFSGICEIPVSMNGYDLVVAGAGIAGICAAVAAARKGLKVALIHNRPLTGGNNSSEIRVQLGGRIKVEPFPYLGNVVDQLDPHFRQNARPAFRYKDELKMKVVIDEPNIDLFLNMQVTDVHIKEKDVIESVLGQDITTGKRYEFFAPLFADCTGDGSVGYRAGAEYRHGREARSETKERLAPKTPDSLTMGSSVMWYSVKRKGRFAFPETPWAVQFTDKTYQKVIRGDWNWELGLGLNQVTDAEAIRDYGFRVIYGNWSFLKNTAKEKNDYLNRRLEWVSYLAGKRESRRLLGDVVLRQQDIEKTESWHDSCIVTTWPIDLHYPIKIKGFDEAPFRTVARKKKIKPYLIPYRCLYSRNIRNLLMAGRNISVTHVALGTARVMRTTGLMGEVVGIAASVCRKYDATPREVYLHHLNELLDALKRGV